jgi:hypothetical protein
MFGFLFVLTVSETKKLAARLLAAKTGQLAMLQFITATELG